MKLVGPVVVEDDAEGHGVSVKVELVVVEGVGVHQLEDGLVVPRLNNNLLNLTEVEIESSLANKPSLVRGLFSRRDHMTWCLAPPTLRMTVGLVLLYFSMAQSEGLGGLDWRQSLDVSGHLGWG